MFTTFSAITLIRYLTAYVFIISGLMKLINPAIVSGLDLPFSVNIMFAVAMLEIICGIFIVINKQVRNAVIPLIIIILAAILITKMPLLETNILTFLFEARLDIVMLILLVTLYYKYSISNV
ncbi:DoxX family membrane protein [Salibacterium salarium]|uniref:DoxX family membrane protein n=1 Tax=Salibacterium salarium TaxID=284579 RepID=A0A3R9PAG3_9BACI|nr:DoxX family membrane protein [Salibacterium salarium]RSL34012.1 DoxX family membrane protein [Salibacterium salarium]